MDDEALMNEAMARAMAELKSLGELADQLGFYLTRMKASRAMAELQASLKEELEQEFDRQA
jgi:hypothetical protein